MKINIRRYHTKDIASMIRIWNEVVEEGIAFPQEDCLTEETGSVFFAGQTHCAIAEECENKKIYGMYILHQFYSLMLWLQQMHQILSDQETTFSYCAKLEKRCRRKI